MDSGMKSNATAHEVGRLAQVSQSAVSRTFTPGASVSEATRDKVLAAANTLGYRPNALARSLITRRSHIIALVMSYLENQFYQWRCIRKLRGKSCSHQRWCAPSRGLQDRPPIIERP